MSTEVARMNVVVVGAGFAGLAAVRALAGAPAEVTVIDRRNYHLFQPLLYQVATASLSPADIAWPVRRLLRDQRNARVVMGRVSGVDVRCRVVTTACGRRFPYDFLVVASGARHAYFGRDDWAETAPGLKKIDDATDIRGRILTAFERAEQEDDPDERRRLMTFAVIGAGPTGIELAGAIAELARHTLRHDFRRIDPGAARVLLVEAGPRILPAFEERLSARAARALERLGVEVLTRSPVTECDPAGIVAGGRPIAARTVVWAAGVMASPAAAWLGAEADRAGRLRVAADLTVPGLENVFAAGDTVLAIGPDGTPVPGVAPAAKQMGQHVGRLIRRRLEGRDDGSEPFRYRDAGSLATIGRGAAVARIGPLRLWGRLAWLIWVVAHVYFLIGARNRMVVAATWAWSYLTLDRGARLITGQQRPTDAPAGRQPRAAA